jgi:hypothetical protein
MALSKKGEIKGKGIVKKSNIDRKGKGRQKGRVL